MTLKILKPKMSVSLILDDEFLRYCELNNIEDVEKFTKEVFNRGFTVIKYGNTPTINLQTETKVVNVSSKVIETDIKIEKTEPVIIISNEIQKEVKKIIRKEIDNKNLYDE